jgi:hypothetical protein
MREKFFIVFEIINIFQAIQFEGIIFAFISIFGHVKKSETVRLLSILVAANLIERRGADLEFYCIKRDARSFIEFEDLNLSTFRLEIMGFYEESFSDTADVVKGLAR